MILSIQRTFLLVMSALVISCGENLTDSEEQLNEANGDLLTSDSINVGEPVDSFIWIGPQKFLVTAAEDQQLFQGKKVNVWLKEDSLLQLNPNVSRAKELILKFDLVNDSSIYLSDIPFGEDAELGCAYYSFQGDIPNSDYWEVFATGYEYHWSVMINKISGDTTITSGRPAFSENGKWLMCANADLEAAFTDNGLELFEVSENRLKLVGKIELPDWGPYSLKWLTNESILITSGKANYENGYEMINKNVILTMVNE